MRSTFHMIYQYVVSWLHSINFGTSTSN